MSVITKKSLMLHRTQAYKLVAYYLGSSGPRYMHSISVQNALDDLTAGTPWRSDSILGIAGLVHDIGYGVKDYPLGVHFLDGAFELEARGYTELADVVAYHSTARWEAQARGVQPMLAEFTPPDSVRSAALWVADFTTSPAGERVSVGVRVADIRARYAPGSAAVAALDASLSDYSSAVQLLADHGFALPAGARL